MLVWTLGLLQVNYEKVWFTQVLCKYNLPLYKLLIQSAMFNYNFRICTFKKIIWFGKSLAIQKNYDLQVT